MVLSEAAQVEEGLDGYVHRAHATGWFLPGVSWRLIKWFPVFLAKQLLLGEAKGNGTSLRCLGSRGEDALSVQICSMEEWFICCISLPLLGVCLGRLSKGGLARQPGLSRTGTAFVEVCDKLSFSN